MKFKWNHSKSKYLKWIDKKCFTKLQKIKKTKIKPTKTGKQPGTTNCLGCKDFTHNFRPKEVKMTLSAKRKIKLYCLSIKQIKIFKTKTQQQKIIELVF